MRRMICSRLVLLLLPLLLASSPSGRRNQEQVAHPAEDLVQLSLVDRIQRAGPAAHPGAADNAAANQHFFVDGGAVHALDVPEGQHPVLDLTTALPGPALEGIP